MGKGKTKKPIIFFFCSYFLKITEGGKIVNLFSSSPPPYEEYDQEHEVLPSLI